MSVQSNITVLTVSSLLTDGSDVSGLTEAYRSSDVAGKAAIRKVVTDVQMAAIDRLDPVVAKAAKDLLVTLKAGSSEKSDIDPKVAFAAYVGSVRKFTESVMSGSFVPSAFADIDPEVRMQVIGDATSDSSDGDLIARFESVRPKSTVRRSVGAHIESVFADATPGTFRTFTEIANVRSEVYGDDRPSAGAVAAHADRIGDESGLSVSTEKRGSRIVRGLRKSA
jgi:hypothetical protein